MTHAYNIKSSEIFSAAQYPHVVNEVMNLKQRSIDMNTAFKEQVVISFLKHHSIASKWLETDTEICKLVTSGAVTVLHLESLFHCGRDNQNFLDGLENYIKTQLQANN